MRVRLIKDFSLPLRQPAKSQAAPELLMPLDLDDSFAFHQLRAWLCSSVRLGWDGERSAGKSCPHLPSPAPHPSMGSAGTPPPWWWCCEVLGYAGAVWVSLNLLLLHLRLGMGQGWGLCL